MPLSFFNQVFGELSRDRFHLVPRWDYPAFRNLRFKIGMVPAWVHPSFGPVVVAGWGEQNVGCESADRPTVRWWTGWYALRPWFEATLPARLTMIHFWREEWAERKWGRTADEVTVDYGWQEATITVNGGYPDLQGGLDSEHAK